MAETDNLKSDGSEARTPEVSGGLQPKSGEVAKESTAKTVGATSEGENEPKAVPEIKPSSEPSIPDEEESAKGGLADHLIRWGPLILIVFLILVMRD